MKVFSSSESFQPFDIRIVIESPDDAARLFAAFNYADVAKETVGSSVASEICQLIKQGAGKVDYMPYHNKLHSALSRR